ncbi:MAG: type VI secretion system tube protein Hcp [Alphaproteobacteria bacterium]|nr:type VI secretion system tube protein Hcp [Alphaproteobacteria bacterium]
MALVVHMSVEGKSQGLISEKCSQQEGREDTIQVFQIDHAIDIPKDKQSGRIIGQRFHAPVEICKEIDRSSPMLAQALVRAEELTLKLQFYRFNPDGSGAQEQFYTMTLEGAQLVSFKSALPFVKDPDTAGYPPLERMQVAYRRIELTYEPDGITFVDDWNTPV